MRWSKFRSLYSNTEPNQGCVTTPVFVLFIPQFGSFDTSIKSHHWFKAKSLTKASITHDHLSPNAASLVVTTLRKAHELEYNINCMKTQPIILYYMTGRYRNTHLRVESGEFLKFTQESILRSTWDHTSISQWWLKLNKIWCYAWKIRFWWFQ